MEDNFIPEIIKRIDIFYEDGVAGSTPFIRTNKMIYDLTRIHQIDFSEFEYLLAYNAKKAKELL